MTTARKPMTATMRIDIAPDGTAVEPEEQAGPTAGNAGESCRLIGSPDFRELLQHVYDGALITTPQGKIVRTNPRACQFFQYDADSLARFQICDLISGADAGLLDTICQTLENQRFVLIEALCYRSDSSLFTAEIAVNSLRISDESYMCFFVRDISLRRKQEEKLRTGNTALENAECVIGVCNLDGTVTYQNPALPKLLDTHNQVATLLWEHLADPSLAAGITADILNQQSWTGQLRLVRSDAQQIFAQATFAPNISGDGEVTGMVFSFVDITTQKQAQEELMLQSQLIREDLKLAQEFQQAMLRQTHPTFPPGAEEDASAVRIGQLYLPSSAVGGDFVDILPLSDTRVGVFIADVMGHGVRSALIVATVRGLVEEIAPRATDAGNFLTLINRDLASIFEKSGQVAFVTACFVIIDLRTGETQIASAGHPRPIRISRSQRTIEKVQFSDASVRGPALGLFPDSTYVLDTIKLSAGDLLLLYTDGLSEAENANGVAFNSPRIQSALEPCIDASPREMLDRLVEAASLFCSRTSFEDDICLVAAELAHLIDEGAPAPASSALL